MAQALGTDVQLLLALSWPPLCTGFLSLLVPSCTPQKKREKKMFPVKYYLTAYYIFFMTSDITLVVSIQHSFFMLECAGEDRSGGEKD